MHNAALSALGLPQTYSLRPCTAAELPRVLDDAERQCRGINVTAPHKQAVAERYANALDDDALLCRAVNTVVFADDGAVRALNTDVIGLRVAWKRAAVDVTGRIVAVVGAGGAARGVVRALKHAGAAGVVIYARRREAASELVVAAARSGLDGAIGDGPEPDVSMAVFAASVLDDDGAWIDRVLARPGVVHDLRYGRAARGLRNAALTRGHIFLDGGTMLLAQGRAALAAFLGMQLPPNVEDAMTRAVAAFLTS
jgi:shikimate dehydrogenase